MKRFIFVLLAVLTLTTVCTPCVCAYDIASEQAEAFGTTALESALPAQTYDAFGTLTVADAAHPRPLLQKLWGYVLREGGGSAGLGCAQCGAAACSRVSGGAVRVAVGKRCVRQGHADDRCGGSGCAERHSCDVLHHGRQQRADNAARLLQDPAAEYVRRCGGKRGGDFGGGKICGDIALSRCAAVGGDSGAAADALHIRRHGHLRRGARAGRAHGAERLLRKALRLLLIGFAGVFTLYLSLTGILTGSADAAAAKAVKTAVSAALPVVGSIVADAAATVTASAAILRGGIGIIGVMSVAAVCVTPYLQLAVHYALYKLAAGIAESFADKRVGRLIGGFADVYGFLLGMVGVASLILFLSIVSSMKAVTG